MPTPLDGVAICNLALARIGVLTPITSLTSDTSTAGKACRAVYDFVRQRLLRDFPWGWASKYAVLTQVNDVGTRANAEWLYAYAYPTDCLFIRRLIATPSAPQGLPAGTTPWPNGDREDTNHFPAPFEIGYLGDAQVIFTDLANASCKYTFDQGNTGPMVAGFDDCFAWGLAVELAMSMANQEGTRQRAEKMFELMTMRGAAKALNEAQNSKPIMTPTSEYERGRFVG